MKNPVNLQINNSGAWRQVLRFDSANAQRAELILSHADSLARLSDSRLRVTSADGNQTVLKRWSIERGWHAAEDQDSVLDSSQAERCPHTVDIFAEAQP